MFSLLDNYIDKGIKNLIKKKIKLNILGNLKPFPKKLKLKIKDLVKQTNKNNTIQVNMALNYGSREEIIYALNKIKKKSLKINEKNVRDNLYTKNIPDPEILIRTGNTNRISNFLIWQTIYSEIFLKKKIGRIY